MLDPVVLAYINMYAILGSIENLCELDEETRKLLKGKKPVSIGFNVKGGPQASLWFVNESCTLMDGITGCDIVLPFSSPKKFNALIDGTGSAFPKKGLSKLKFLLKTFTPITDRLGAILRPDPAMMEDPEFFRLNTLMTFYVVVGAIAQLGNHDKIGSFSASNIIDGTIELSIKDGPKAYISSMNHVLFAIKSGDYAPRARMEFGSLEIANDLFNDKINSMAAIAEGKIIMQGMINMLDNMNRILDRVSMYLA